MALVINLHGPNTNTLGNLTAGALAEIGYSAVAVPSCRREMELAALSGNEQAIRLTDAPSKVASSSRPCRPNATSAPSTPIWMR